MPRRRVFPDTHAPIAIAIIQHLENLAHSLDVATCLKYATRSLSLQMSTLLILRSAANWRTLLSHCRSPLRRTCISKPWSHQAQLRWKTGALVPTHLSGCTKLIVSARTRSLLRRWPTHFPRYSPTYPPHTPTAQAQLSRPHTRTACPLVHLRREWVHIIRSEHRKLL